MITAIFSSSFIFIPLVRLIFHDNLILVFNAGQNPGSIIGWCYLGPPNDHKPKRKIDATTIPNRFIMMSIENLIIAPISRNLFSSKPTKQFFITILAPARF
jgi:hypothetical protein